MPAVEVFQDPLDDVRFLDQGDDAHERTAAGRLERSDFVDFLDQPCPMGPLRWVAGSFVNRRDRALIGVCRLCVLLFGLTSFITGAIGVITVVKGPGIRTCLGRCSAAATTT